MMGWDDGTSRMGRMPGSSSAELKKHLKDRFGRK